MNTFGNAPNLVAALQQTGLSLLGQTGSKIIFRSNITPEIEIDVANLSKPGSSAQPRDIASNSKTLGLIKPKATLRALGLQVSRAPYGEPNPNGWMFVLLGFICAGLIGMRLTWATCKTVNRVKNKSDSKKKSKKQK